MKAPKVAPADTEWNSKTKVFVTTLPDSITVGWDVCGRCDRHYKTCSCETIALPRHVISLRADAVRRGFVVSDVLSESSDDASGGSLQPDGSELSQTVSDGRTDAESFECPADDCAATITDAHDYCPECGQAIEWEDEE